MKRHPCLWGQGPRSPCKKDKAAIPGSWRIYNIADGGRGQQTFGYTGPSYSDWTSQSHLSFHTLLGFANIYLNVSSAGMGLPGGSDGKQSACNTGDPSPIPGLGRSPEKGNSKPLQYSCLENSMNRDAWHTRVHGVAKSRSWLTGHVWAQKQRIMKILWSIVLKMTTKLKYKSFKLLITK